MISLGCGVLVALGIGIFVIFAVFVSPTHPVADSRGSANGGAPTPPLVGSVPPVVKGATPAAKITAAALREQLRVAYERMMRINHAHLNYIKVRVGKGPRGGASLLAVHEYFGRYTLSIGPTAREITDWINDNRDDLKAANITRVGVAAKDDFAGESFFDLDK